MPSADWEWLASNVKSGVSVILRFLVLCCDPTCTLFLANVQVFVKAHPHASGSTTTPLAVSEADNLEEGA